MEGIYESSESVARRTARLKETIRFELEASDRRAGDA